MRDRFYNYYLLVFFIVFALYSSSLVAETTGKQSTKTVLTVAFDFVDYKPYNYRDETGPKGFVADILNYIEANSDLTFNYVYMPWNRVLELTTIGKIDIIPTIFRTLAREQVYHFVEPSYGVEVTRFAVLANSSMQYNGDLKSMTSHAIGVARGFSYGETFDNATYLNTKQAANNKALLQLLLNGQFPVIVGNETVLYHLAKELDSVDKIKYLAPKIESTPVYIAIGKRSKNADRIKSTFERLLKIYMASQEYTQLLNKYQLSR